MYFFQSHFTFSCFSLALMLVSISLIDGKSGNEEAFQFFEAFSSQEAAFDAVFALSELTVTNRGAICRKFTDGEEGTSSYNILLLVHLNPVPGISESGLWEIPAFVCTSSGEPSGSFFVTYSSSNGHFFKLDPLETPISNLTDILVEVSESKKLPEFEIHDVSQKVVDYLSSTDYVNSAEANLANFVMNKKWTLLCRAFSPLYKLPKKTLKSHSIKSSNISIHHATFIKIPILPCPFDPKSKKVVYIAFYTGNIYFGYHSNDKIIKYHLGIYLSPESSYLYRSISFKSTEVNPMDFQYLDSDSDY